jgi:hypothetical protein
MPDTAKHFTVVTDASAYGMGAVLMQEEHPVAYWSRLFNPAQQNYTVTERELMAVVEALKHWRCYLGDKPFTVVTDHSPLTHFSTKKDLHGRQARWSEVLAMFAFAWEYRPGRTNVADPFSRHPTMTRGLAAITRGRAAVPANAPAGTVTPPAVSVAGSAQEQRIDQSVAAAGGRAGGQLSPLELDISKGYAFDPMFSDTKYNHRWKFQHSLWFTIDGQIAVPDLGDLREQVIAAHHTNTFSGHPGVARTADSIKRGYWWKGMKKQVAEYVSKCHECQTNKSAQHKPSGLLQPLSIPERPWSNISVDFVTGLPPMGEHKYDTITVFVDRLTKMVHYVPCVEKMPAADFAQLFIAQVFRLHGLPLHIVSDRDPRFTSVFWKEVTAALGMERGFSTAFHPQTDGQTERMNRTMEEMLRHFITPMKGDWVSALPMLEFAYNNAFNATTKSTPFRLNTGLNPLHPASNVSERTYQVPAAQLFVDHMSDELKRAKQCMLDAQTRMKSQADKRRQDVTFAVGDSVLLATKNLKLKGDSPRKLLPRYIGPFKVLQTVGKVSYKIALPEQMRVHNVFHVSLLQPYKSNGQRHPPPPEIVDGELEYTIEAVTAHRVSVVGGKRKAAQRNKVEFLVCWDGYGREHDTWEPAEVVQDALALDSYLRQLVKRKGVLPPGFYPDEQPTQPARKRMRSPSPARSVVPVVATDVPLPVVVQPTDSRIRKRVRFVDVPPASH